MENTENINERIALLVRSFGRGRNTTFASLIDSSEGNIRGYINKGVMPKQDVLERIVRSLGVSATWLLTGEGPMMEEERATEANTEHLVSVPIVDISAAAGVVGYENPTYLEEVDRIAMPLQMINKRNQYYCIRIKGESMSPTMLDSGYVVARQLETAEWGDMMENYVYVISTKEGCTYVKRIKNRLRQKGFVVCMSDNPDKAAYPNFNVYEDELHCILQVEWYFTAKMPNIHETYYKKVEDLEIKYEELQEQINELRDQGVRRS
ncbi:helix-turn-helix transcriptional regulator [Bacteroides sp. 224]|uniref:S24 family peptidase n=1 Tax=Bacteroides sp. 224 TaxID=2302936 RepID=UPI0013D15F45|nr:helix-turn-helix transcriptional regulator [Bacteroides sp. 224]NDV63760.1 helix-turn-helix transcriptional regulator [Bacteroides sp. 224]